jgi:hypothetical protein
MGAGVSKPFRPNQKNLAGMRKLGDKETGGWVTSLTLSIFMVNSESEFDSRPVGELLDVDAHVGCTHLEKFR